MMINQDPEDRIVLSHSCTNDSYFLLIIVRFCILFQKISKWSYQSAYLRYYMVASLLHNDDVVDDHVHEF